MKNNNLSDKDRLNMFNMMYNGRVMCTNGLFHMYNNKHQEIYLNKNTGEPDKRALYDTVVVLEHIIVSRVLNSSKIRYVILDKNDLKCLYKTNGNITYVDKNIICNYLKDDCILISPRGRVLSKLYGVDDLVHIHDNLYIVNSKKMFRDKILEYNAETDLITELTKNKEFLVKVIDKDSTLVEVTLMQGGQYHYNFETRQLKNLFTGKIEDNVELWTIS